MNKVTEVITDDEREPEGPRAKPLLPMRCRPGSGAAAGCIALGAVVVALLGSICGVRGAGAPSPEKLLNYTPDRKPTFLSANPKLLLAIGLCGGGVLALLGYLYGREWYLNRGFRHYRTGLAPNVPIGVPIASTGFRTSWFKRGTSAQSSRRQAAQEPQRTIEKNANSLTPASGGPAAKDGNPNQPGLVLGRLNVLADDEFHEIFVDGQFMGMAPGRLNLTAGQHLIEFVKSGRRIYTREIRIVPAGEVNLRPPPLERVSGNHEIFETSEKGAFLSRS